MVTLSQRAFFTAVSAFLLISGCAGKDPRLVGGTDYQSPCPSDLTPACYEYIGKKMRCYCTTRDGLREIFEPENL